MDTILKTSENTDKFWPAFIKAKGEMGQPELNCRNPHFRSKYADLSSLFKCIREPFKANGLNFIQTFGHRDGNGVLETRIIHISGQWISGEWVFGTEGNIQKLGAQFTYLKRYHLYSMLGLAGEEDTDGQMNGSGKPEPVRHVKPYNPMTDPYDKRNPGHNTVFLAKLKEWAIQPSLTREAIEKCHGKTAGEWGAIIKGIGGAVISDV